MRRKLNKETAFIAIGSNLGDRLSNCRRGIEAIESLVDTAVQRTSPFYHTSPVDYLDQDWFANCAIQIETALDPFELLYALKEIERRVGRRESAVRFGPRLLDLDIVFYGDQVLETEQLILPHPRMHKRGFVLRPLCDIDPDIMHPVLKKNIGLLLALIDDETQKVLPYVCSDMEPRRSEESIHEIENSR